VLFTTELTDFILEVRVASTAGFKQSIREVLASHDTLAKLTSYVALGEVKIGLILYT
jgi:DNA-binding Lrp family transcriptional regulator